MRVLIFSVAIIAWATAAPSGEAITPAEITPAATAEIAPAATAEIAPAAKAEIAPAAKAEIAPAAKAEIAPAAPAEITPLANSAPELLPIAQPTISPGDLQAAAIDLKVQQDDTARIIEDQARVLADQAREQAEIQAAEEQDKVVETENENRARSLQAFWSVEDQKWLAFDTLKTAEAQLDGALARDAPTLTHASLGTFVGSVVPPLITIGPNPNVIVTKAAQPNTEAKPEAQKAETEVKTADVTAKQIKIQAIPQNGVQRLAENTVILGHAPLIAPVGFAPGLRVVDPWVTTPLTYYHQYQPGFVAASTVQQYHAPSVPLASTYINSQW